MRKSFLKKLLSLTLATVMAIPSFVMPVQAAETSDVPTPVYQYAFEDSLAEAGGIITADTKVASMGTYSGTVSYGEARDGVGKAINLGASYGLDLNIPNMGSDYTLSVWVKPTGSLIENQQVFFLGTNTPNEDWIGLAGNTTGNLKLWTREVIDGTQNGWITGVDDVAYTTNEWQQYILSVDNGNASIYIDGELFGSGSLSATALSRETSDAYIGVNFWADRCFNGLVDDVKIYDTAVTADQAAALYAEESKVDIVLADFTFDDVETGFKGGEAVAEAAGTIVEDGDRKVLQLNGSASDWLNVTKADGSSLLAGVEELTVTFDIKTNGSNWPLFIAPNANRQTYRSEKYIGVLAGSNFVVERYYSDEQDRPGFSGASFPTGEWASVKLEFTKDTTTITINDGTPVVQTGLADLATILGESPILQIGKGNWEGGEYFTGSLDNFKITTPAPDADPVGDKTALQAAVTAAKDAGLVEADYVASSWANYTEAIAVAEAMLADTTEVKQSEVNAVLYALAAAQSSLVKIEDSIVANALADYDFADFAAGEGDTLVDDTRTITLESVGNGVKPVLAADEERGQVLDLSASDYNNRAFALLPSNPFAGKDVSEGLTLNFWTNTQGNYGGGRCLIDFEVAPATTGRAGTYAVNQGMVYWNTTDQNGAFTDFNIGNLGLRQSGWKMVTMVVTTSGIEFYSNGAKINHSVSSGAENYNQMINDIAGTSGLVEDPAETNVRIGASLATYWTCANALIDDISFYGKALTADEIATLFDETTTTIIPALELEVSGASSVKQDKTLQLSASVEPAEATNKKDLVWVSSDESVLTVDANGLVTAVGGGTATVTAKIGALESEPFEIKVIPVNYTDSLEEGYYLTVYSTTTRFYASASNVDQETRSVYMAVSSDGKNFNVLNNGGGVIFSKSEQGTLQITEPAVFKAEDGTFTVVAQDYDATKGYHVFTSEDGVNYYDDTVVETTDMIGSQLRKANFTLMLDGENLLETDANITLGNAVELTEEEYTYIVNKLGTVKNNGLSALEDVNVEVGGELTEDMLPASVTATYTDGSAKDFDIDWTGALDGIDLSKDGTYEVTGTVVQTKYLNNLKELNGSTLPEDNPENENTDYPTNYDPETKTVYYDETKYIEGMADPNIFWDEQTGYYYMTGSYFPEEGDAIDENDNTQQYDRVVLRRSRTLEGLQDRSQQVTIWKAGNQGYINNNGEQVARGYRYIWAPEIHRVGDYWVVYFTESQSSNVFGIYSHALVLDGDLDPYETALTASDEVSQWQDYQMDSAVDSEIKSIETSFCLDMTYFKDAVNGTSYVVWAGKPTISYGGSSTDLFIATVDEENPWILTSQQKRLTWSEYGWERIRYCVNEGATILQHDGNVFMAYSVSGTGSEYAIGMLSAKAGTDLLDINNWVKSPYPVLTSRDVDGEEGPGHNSFTVDQDGNVIFVYHARPTSHNYQMCGWDGTSSSYNGEPLNDPCRHARLKRVHWAADGTPILKMTYDNELLEENQTVTLKVVVGEGGEISKGENVALKATTSASYNTTWNKGDTAVNDGDNQIPEDDTYAATANLYTWGTWGNTSASEWITLTWETPVEIESSDLYIWTDNGGIHVPVSYTYEYRPEGSEEWVALKTVDEGVTAGLYGELNSVTFDEAVKATALRVTFAKDAEDNNGVGLVEWEVYGTVAGGDVVTPVDKADLEKAIADALPVEDADKYTEESWADYTAALENAENVLADEDATQSEVDAAIAALENAEASLEEKLVIDFPFVDVTEDDWFYDSVYFNFVEKTMTGMDNTHFGPYESLSRAQFALILYRIEGEPEVDTDKKFHDISGDEWYGQAVLWAAEAGIVTGYENGNYGPVDLITREQMAVMMYRYAKYLKEDVSITGDLSKFKDVASVSEFATEAMSWANGMGIITGKEEGTKLDPQGVTARAEAAAIIERFMK